MKKILIPALIVIIALFVVAVILGRSNKANSSQQNYHTHADGSTHYDVVETTAQEYHVHEDGETHYGEH